MTEKLVVTRHKNLVRFLKERHLIDNNTKIISHAKEQDVKGMHVLGVIPYWLACHAEKITEIQIRIPKEKRGTELSIEDIRFYACDPKTYRVKEVKF